jgi:hypothetical protein
MSPLATGRVNPPDGAAAEGPPGVVAFPDAAADDGAEVAIELLADARSDESVAEGFRHLAQGGFGISRAAGAKDGPNHREDFLSLGLIDPDRGDLLLAVIRSGAPSGDNTDFTRLV